MTHRPSAADADGDPAVQALVELRAKLDSTIASLTAAAERIDPMVTQRRAGKPWSAITLTEPQPVITEITTRALDELGEIGSKYRREKANALRCEGLSMRTVGELLGVTRQRVWTLLRDRPEQQELR